MGRAVLLILLGTLSVFTIVSLNVNSRINDSLDLALNYYSDNQARNIANSIAQIQVSILADSSDYRVTSTVSESLFGGTAYYSVRDTTIASTDYIVVNATGEHDGVTRNVTVFAIPPGGGIVPPTVKAAITTNNPVETKGNIKIDGRNHDLAGNLVPNSGTKAIWTTNNLQRKGNSKLGATTSGVDYALQKSENNNLRLEFQAYPGGYPDTPDSLLGGTAGGFPPGHLKSVAVSGSDGSQYTTNPASLTYPLTGITYVELPPAGTWNPINIEGSGILIVHNSTSNSIMKNINWGTFKGLIIADDVIHIHANIIGALISLTPSPSAGNCIGNGNGEVKYSSEAVQNATGIVLGGAADNYGFAASRIEISDWFE